MPGRMEKRNQLGQSTHTGASGETSPALGPSHSPVTSTGAFQIQLTGFYNLHSEGSTQTTPASVLIRVHREAPVCFLLCPTTPILPACWTKRCPTISISAFWSPSNTRGSLGKPCPTEIRVSEICLLIPHTGPVFYACFSKQNHGPFSYPQQTESPRRQDPHPLTQASCAS